MAEEARTEFDLREQLARIDQMRAESQKFAAEQAKLSTEQGKLLIEAFKLRAEEAKLNRERWWFPWLQLITVAASGGAVAALVSWGLK
jgi:hypothetical protein